MKANAWHHRVDAISSVVALIGVGKTSFWVIFFIVCNFEQCLVEAVMSLVEMQNGNPCFFVLYSSACSLPIPCNGLGFV